MRAPSRRKIEYTWSLVGIIFGFLALCAIVIIGAQMAFITFTSDVYEGVITRDPAINRDGDREISLLPDGADKAHTIGVRDFCALPFTKFCRFDSADVHGSFVVGKRYCVVASGWRIPFWSMTPNLVEVLTDSECQ